MDTEKELKKIPVTRVNPDPGQGLTKEQVIERIRAHAVNKKVDSSTQSVKEIVRSNVCTYFNLIFLILGVLLVAARSFRDLTFLPVIIANTCIGIFQEIQAKKVLDNLSIMNAPSCTVIRDGEQKTVKAEHLVLDDIAIFAPGNQIPADAIVVSGNVSVNESLITGESDEIQKGPGDGLLSGSFIVSGKCVASLEKVGADSYISRLTIQATKTKSGEQSEMIRSLNRLVMAAGILIIPIGLTLFIQQYALAETDFATSVTSMVAAIIGMIPEGLYLLASVALAVSAMRLAKQKVLLHDMKCIETLARVDVLCVDKTGTITVPDMEVAGFEPLKDISEEYAREKICDLVSNMTVDNATMEAMGTYFTGESAKKAVRVFSFSSEYKYSAVAFSDENLVLGAPEFVLGHMIHAYRDVYDKYSKKGYRVLAFGRYKDTLDGGALGTPIEPIAFIFLTNAIRKGAVDTFKYFGENGVNIKVISGDNPATVSEIAKKAGIANAENYVDASTLKSYEEIYDATRENTVFGRVTPTQKRIIVKALKEQGKTVAMTGDGVNDVLALRDADCSIAMASGSEAACQAAQLVLLDSDFHRMPSVVMEGRRVVNNIERSATLYLVKNIFSMLLAIFSMILMWNYPLVPSQVSLISMFTIGIPSFVLALEPNKEKIKGHFMQNVLIKALPAGLTDFMVVSGLVIFCREFNVDEVCVSTSCTILVAIVGFMILYKIAEPMTKTHVVLLIGVIIGWLFCMLFVRPLFAITSISKQCAMLMVIFALITEPALRYLTKLSQWLEDRLNL